MKLYELLQIKPGVTALMGSGGKTSLMYHLAGELSKKHKVLLSPTIFRWLPPARSWRRCLPSATWYAQAHCPRRES